MKKENIEYNLFMKMFSEETGVTDKDRIAMLMSKLKRAEGKLRRMFEQDCNEGETADRKEIETNLQIHVIDLMKKYQTIKVRFNSDPRGGAIRLIFKKTGWYNTLGSDVAIDW